MAHTDTPALQPGFFSAKAIEVLRYVKAGTPYAANQTGRENHLEWLVRKGVVVNTGSYPQYALTEFGERVLALTHAPIVGDIHGDV